MCLSKCFHLFPIRLDSDMPEEVEIMNSTLLFLRPLLRNDSGVYRCEVANDINLRSRDVRILIQGELTRTQLTVYSYLRKHCVCSHLIVSMAMTLSFELKCDTTTLAPSVRTDSP